MSKPHILGAPGLVWRKLANGAWQGMWRARADIIDQGYLPKNRQVWVGDIYGSHPDQTERAAIADACANLQDEMLAWSRSNGVSVLNVYDHSAVFCAVALNESVSKTVSIPTRRR